MKRFFFIGLLLPFSLCSFAQVTNPTNLNEPFSKRSVRSDFNNAWEVLYGPNDSLWVTENRGYRIRRINVKEDGTSTFGDATTLLSLFTEPTKTNLGITITQTTASFPQGGLMGMALHPNLYSTDPAVRNAKPWVYVAFVYTKALANNTPCPNGGSGCFYTTKIVRFTYSGNALINPVTVLDNIPGSSDHNSGRLVISPVIETLPAGGLHNQYRLYYTVGDMGAGQYANTTRAQNALVQNSLEGKVLRINTESDGDTGANQWIPNDNPFYNASTINPEDYVFSLGHRNAQGLVWGKVNGVDRLYSSEQMNRSDDEINIIGKGRNYGWDRVSGYCDGNLNGYRAGTVLITNEVTNCNNITNNTEPIYTMFTTPASGMAALQSQNDNGQWPTIACSSIDFIGNSRIAGWSNSLFVTPLKKDFVYRLKLNETGDGVQPVIYELFKGDGGRIRDIAISPNGRRFFVARDGGENVGNGTIMAYNYTGTLLALNDKPGEGNAAVSDNLDIYPNPVTSVLTIKGKKEFQKPLLAQLYDATGSVVETKSSFQNTFTLDIAKQKAGIYFLKLYNGNGQLVETRKVVKQ